MCCSCRRRRTRKRVKSNYQVSKFILVYPKTGPKQQLQLGSNTKSCQGSERNLKTSAVRGEVGPRVAGVGVLPGRLTLCPAALAAQNDLWRKCIGTQCKVEWSSRCGRAGAGREQDRSSSHDEDDDDVAGRGYPFQHFRFITIIFTLQSMLFFFFWFLLLVFLFGFLFSIIYWPCACVV